MPPVINTNNEITVGTETSLVMPKNLFIQSVIVSPLGVNCKIVPEIGYLMFFRH